MSDVLSFVDSNLGRFRAEMYDFLRIPSISAKAEHNGDMRRAAEWQRGCPRSFAGTFESAHGGAETGRATAGSRAVRGSAASHPLRRLAPGDAAA